MKRLKEAWNRFFFEPIPATSIAVYRILYGIMVLVYAWYVWREFSMWVIEPGVVSSEAVASLTGPVFSVFPYLPAGNGWVIGFFWIFVGAAVSLTLGFQTRLCTFIVFLALVSLQHRNPFMLNGGFVFLRLASFFLLFSHAGAELSVDRWLRVRRGLEDGSGPVLKAPWAQRMIQFEVSLLYLCTSLWKARGTMWLDGSAVYNVSRVPVLQNFDLPYIFEHMWAMRVASWYTLAVEFALGVFIWVPKLRPWLLLMGVLLHVGIELGMTVPFFSTTMITTYAVFVDPAWLRRVIDGLKQRLSLSSVPSQLNPSSE